MISSRESASATSSTGPPATIHPSFSCGSPAILDKPLSEKQSASAGHAGHRQNALGIVSEGVIGEHLIRDDREPVPRAQPRQFLPLMTLEVGARRVVRVHQDDGPGAFRDARLQVMQVEMPPTIVEQRVLHHADRLELREKLEQRVRGPGYEHLVARVTEKFEEVRVGLAGTRGEDDAICLKPDASFGVVFADSFAGSRQAEGGGLVA